jgi:cyclohexanecarboxylate-CoA ligase
LLGCWIFSLLALNIRTGCQHSVPLAPTHPNPRAAQYRAAGHWPNLPLGDLFTRTVDRHPDRQCLIDGDRCLTFLELDRLSQRAALGFRSLGMQPGDVIAYQLPTWWEAAVVFLAAARIGATVNPLLPMFRQAELRFTLRQSGARAIVIPGDFRSCDYPQLIADIRGDLPALREVLVARGAPCNTMRDFDAFLATPWERTLHSDALAPLTIDPDGVVLLMYTSGTTAEPKGVLHTHNTLAAEIISLERVHQLTIDDRTLMPSPLTHISGVLHGILTPALLGTSAVLMERWDPAYALELVARAQVTYMVGVPTLLQDLLTHAQTAGERLPSLRLFSCGGAGVSPALMRGARALFPSCVAKRVYGSTEFPTLTTTDAADAATHGIETEGRAIWPAEVRIADAAGTNRPPGCEGEVQGRGPECFAGYLDPSLNADAFTSDGWFRTGDLGVLDADRYLHITGRLKDIVIRKGEKISVKEIEDLIGAHPAVAEVAVIARPDVDAGERACAVVRLRPAMHIDLGSLQSFLAAKGLAKQKWPEQLELVDDFPRTDSGKVSRPKLKEQLENTRPRTTTDYTD